MFKSWCSGSLLGLLLNSFYFPIAQNGDGEGRFESRVSKEVSHRLFLWRASNFGALRLRQRRSQQTWPYSSWSPRQRSRCVCVCGSACVPAIIWLFACLCLSHALLPMHEQNHTLRRSPFFHPFLRFSSCRGWDRLRSSQYVDASSAFVTRSVE